MNKGAFIVSREIFNNPIWQDVQSFRIFFYILGQAVFSDEGVRKGNVHIKKGQYLRSFRNLQSDLEYIENRRIKQYSISTISRKVNSLVSQGRLKIEDTELGTLFTVVNYESYQLLSNYKGTELGTALEQSGNGVGTEQEQNRNNNKNVKNEKNVKEHIPYVEIVDYLNKKAGKKFKSTTNKTREQIKARWNEGHRLEDFKQVIDVCCQKWKGQIFSNGQKGDTYLQPSTLFNGKFDERLNWSIEKTQSTTPTKTKEQIEHERMVKEMGLFDD